MGLLLKEKYSVGVIESLNSFLDVWLASSVGDAGCPNAASRRTSALLAIVERSACPPGAHISVGLSRGV